MSFNTFGKQFRFTTWGESHGPALGCVVDGCPPNINLKEQDIQVELDMIIEDLIKNVNRIDQEMSENEEV